MKKFTLWLLFAFVALVANAGNFSVYLKIDGTNVLETSTVKVHIWNSDKDTNTTWGDNGSSLPQVTNIITDVDGAKYFKYPLTDSDNKYNFLFICDGKQSHDYYDATTDIVITYKGTTSNGKYEYKASTTAPVEPASIYLKGANYNNWADGPKLEYKPEDKTYVYTETTPANLASNFKILIDGGWYRYGDYISWNLSKNENNIRTYAEIKTFADENNMKIEDAANFSSITIKVKKDGDVWKMQVEGTPTGGGGSEGEKDHTVTMKGKAWSWNQDKFTFTKQGDGTYAYTFTGNDKAGLAQEFAFTIDGKDYSYRTDLEVNTGDAYVMETNQKEKNYKIPTAANYSDITLTVAFSNGTPSLKVTGTEDEVTYPATVTIVGEMTGWAERVYTIKHKGNGIYEGELDTRTKSGFWRIYEEWDGKWGSDTSWGYDSNQEGDNFSGTFKKGKTGNANTTTKKLWWLTFDINTGAWSLEEQTDGIESIDNEGVKIVAGKGTITVSGATNVEVYTAGGALVSREAESHVAAGLYIVRTDNKVAKVIVR